MDIRLIFIAQAVTNSDVRPHAPIVLRVYAQVVLRHRSFRISGVDTKLRCAPAARANVGRAEPESLQGQCTPIAFEAIDHQSGSRDGIVIRIELRNYAAGKDILTAKIRRVDVINVHSAHAAAKLENMLAL